MRMNQKSVVAVSFAISVLYGHTALAAACGDAETSIVACGSSNSIWSIPEQIINIMAMGIGLVAVGGFVYGGMLYASASNDPSKISSAKKTIANVVIGLVLFVGMYSFIQYLIPGGLFDRNLSSPTGVASSQRGKTQTSNSDNPSQPGGGAFNLTFATYNVRTHGLRNDRWGDYNKIFDRKDDKRMQGIASIVNDNGVDIVAFQEIGNASRGSLLTHLGKKWKMTSVAGGGDTQVAWNNEVYRVLDTGTVLVHIKPNQSRPDRWAKLQHRGTGRYVYVTSFHLATKGSAGSQSMKMQYHKKDAQSVLKMIKNLSNGTFIVAGDMNANDNPRSNEPYRSFKGSGLLYYTREASKTVIGNNCDTHNDNAGSGGRQECRVGRGSHIDHIWVTKNPKVELNSYRVIATRETSQVSDHNPIVVKLRVLEAK